MKKLFALASIATLMFSCSDNFVETPFEEKLPINISVDVQTRANDTTFESGDAVGIYVVNYDGATAGTLKAEGNQADNAEFTYNGGGWNSDEPIYWKDKNTSADFYAYYPYSASVNIEAQPFAVQVDQSNEANFWASDFLWGKSTKVAPTSNAVNIETNHVLSRIVLEVKPGSGFTSESWAAATKSIKICDVKTSATINLATGVATATGNNGEIIPLATSSNYKAMMVPQVVADDSKLIVVTVDGTEYVYRTGYTFKANTQHNFSIVVNKNESSVNVAIGEWNIDSTVNQGAAVEEAKESIPEIPNNEIWYTTSDGNAIVLSTTPSKLVSNTYVDGKGVMLFDGDVTNIFANQFKSATNLSSIIIPNSV
ncbi:MAG: fimbrillin family protein, partial [Alistipes sp.]|nr:fimbrillin family protein [Alistipes sp.]